MNIVSLAFRGKDAIQGALSAKSTETEALSPHRAPDSRLGGIKAQARESWSVLKSRRGCHRQPCLDRTGVHTARLTATLER